MEMRSTLFIVWKRALKVWRRTQDSHWVLYAALVASGWALALALWNVVGPYLWKSPTAEAFNKVTGGISSSVTAVAVVTGGIWAYFKFVRGRTFVARLSIELDGEWRRIHGMTVLHVRVRVKNIGAAKVAINQFGSGVEVGFPAGEWHRQVTWEKVKYEGGGPDASDEARQFSVLTEHEWIEPGETVSDEVLLHLEGRQLSPCMLELKLMTALSEKQLGKYSDEDTEVFARRVVAPDDKLLDRLK